MRSRTLLACGLLLLEDCVDVIHFAQPLEEGDEVQQLGVGHVVEPRGHRHLEENTNYQQTTPTTLFVLYCLFFFILWIKKHNFVVEINSQISARMISAVTKNAAQMDMVTFRVFPHILRNMTVELVINQQNRTE